MEQEGGGKKDDSVHESDFSVAMIPVENSKDEVLVSLIPQLQKRNLFWKLERLKNQLEL